MSSPPPFLQKPLEPFLKCWATPQLSSMNYSIVPHTYDKFCIGKDKCGSQSSLSLLSPSLFVKSGISCAIIH